VNATPFRPARAHGMHLHAVNDALPLQPFPATPRRIASESEAVHLARIAAIRRLGTSWRLHPAYVPNPRHSCDPNVYGPARAPYFAQIAAMAAASRALNPAWAAAERVRIALGPQQA
jgi:hypothetical protein